MSTNASTARSDSICKLERASEYLKLAIAEIDGVCENFSQNSAVRLLLFGQIMPKIRSIVSNPSTKIDILGIIQLLKAQNETE